MTFASRITRSPIAHDRAAAAEMAQVFGDLPMGLRDLLANSAACSPYLRTLMQREADWLRGALAIAPEVAFDAVLAALPGLGSEALATGLRQAKRRAALLIGLADLGGVWSLEAVTGALTTLADLAVDLCLRRLVADEVRRGKLPATDAVAGGIVALAMGKMGAAELNYSSDIDLIVLFDDSLYPGAEQEARAALIRVTRRMTATLSDITADGYVFRCDLRLRPDAAVTPVCLSMSMAEAYYESVGRTWERAAFIKARPCGGDIAAGARFLKSLIPFVWRRHLDFAAIQDAHDMRLRIRDHRGLHGPIRLPGHNMKLGAGGIREIEFFTQTRQLIAGGRDPDLRARTTTGGLAALAAKGWLPGAVAAELTALYRAHREIEHRLQMVGDAQTHDLPTSDEGIARIADFCGQEVAAFRQQVMARLTRTAVLTEDFFAPTATATEAEAQAPDLSAQNRAIIEAWAQIPALRSDRAREIFRRLRPMLLARLMQAEHPDEALLALDGFLRGLPAGVQIFSLFEANPSLVDLIVDIAGTAPVLAQYLSRNAAVLDAVIGGAFFAPWPGQTALGLDLTLRLAGAADYEAALDQARIWAKEWHFRIGVHHLRGLIDADCAGGQYADLAGAVLAALWPGVVADFAAKHGAAPGRGAVLVAMGSLGAGRLNAGSDLDLIVIYDAAGVEASQGPRPLAARPYYARLTQAMITALTAQLPHGRLYEVDMRLRPSGRQGPVATSLDAFCAYQQTEAWTWEHLALTRARVVAGSPDLAAEFEAFRGDLLRAKGGGAQVRGDVAEMRARLAAARPGVGDWQTKLGPGRLMDIELTAQMLALIAGQGARDVLAQIDTGEMAGLVSQNDATALRAAYRLCWHLHAAARLLSDKVPDPARLGLGGRAFVLRETGQPDVATLTDQLAVLTGRADAVINALMGKGA